MDKVTQHKERLLGKRLKKDIFSDKGLLILSADTVLNEEHLNNLQALHLELFESDIEKHDHFDIMVDQAVEQVQDIFDVTRYSDKIPLLQVREHIIPAIHAAAENQRLLTLLESLQSKDDYTYRHNIGVGVIAALIGKWLKLENNELSALTIAATLHDVGKMKIPEEVLNKPGKLTAEEYSLMKKHTIFGYNLLKNTTGTSHRQALVALQHHEREDGSGYPFGLKEDKIDLFSKIVAVADIFHAMTSNRSYHGAVPFYKVIKQMQDNIYGVLDPFIVNMFLHD